MATPDPIEVSWHRPGPIRHDSLSPDVLEHIKAIFDVVGPYLGTTLEQFEIGFMRVANPDQEVAAWCAIVAAWISYHEQHLGNEFLSDAEEKKLIAALFAISAGAVDTKALGVSNGVGMKLLDCYDSLGKD